MLNKKFLLLFLFPLLLTSCTRGNELSSIESSEENSSEISSEESSSSLSEEVSSEESSSSSSSEEIQDGLLTDKTNYSGRCKFIYNYTGDYYKGISSSLTGRDLLLALDDLLDSTARFTGFTYKKLFKYFIYTDAYDYENIGNNEIASFYSGKKSYNDTNLMNREHVWPNSRGGSVVENDPHMTRPTIKAENSARGNDFFNESPTSWDPASFNNEKYRGIAARIIFYCAVKGQESGLKLVDYKTDSTANKSMGRLSTLLKWNIDYPVDDSELLRNNYLASLNWCRNPFIDDRNYACKIWGNTNDTTRTLCGIH